MGRGKAGGGGGGGGGREGKKERERERSTGGCTWVKCLSACISLAFELGTGGGTRRGVCVCV